MIWSKLKKSVDALLAASVKPHLQLHLTRYGSGVSYIMNRAWITWDGKEISTFSTIRWENARKALAIQITEDGEQRDRWAALRQAGNRLVEQQEVFTRDDFYHALEVYLGLPIEDALQSSNSIIKAWSMFDRRVGKRRLLTMRFSENEHLLVQQWYCLRCQAEGLVVPEAH